MFKNLKKWINAKIREIKDRRIKKLGGWTSKELAYAACGRNALLREENEKLHKENGELKARECKARGELKTTKAELEKCRENCELFERLTAETTKRYRYIACEIPIDPKFGYTDENVIEASKAQMMFKLGQAVYPHAQHEIIAGVYFANVEVLSGKTELP